MSELQLDHTVINVKYQMDQAEKAFSDLGFQLTKRGYHSLGSINHLMMFGTDYLELIGLPAEPQGRPSGRPDIGEAPLGINGLVFKTTDVEKTHAHLQSLGLAQARPKSFSRPVQLPEGSFEAKFSTVHVRADAFPGGRVYFCQHHTPELVWRPEWQAHDNGAKAMPEFVIASNQAQAEAELFAVMLGSTVEGRAENLHITIADTKISLLGPDAYQSRYGALASAMNGRTSIFGALVLQTGGLAGIRKMLASGLDIPHDDQGDRLILRQPDFDAVMEFLP